MQLLKEGMCRDVYMRQIYICEAVHILLLSRKGSDALCLAIPLCNYFYKVGFFGYYKKPIKRLYKQSSKITNKCDIRQTLVQLTYI